MAINKAKTTGKASKKSTTPPTKREESMASTERSTTETPSSDKEKSNQPETKQRKEAPSRATTSNEVKEPGTVETITQEEDHEDDVLEVYTEEEAKAESDEEDALSLDLSDMDTDETTGTPGFVTFHWDGTFPKPESTLAQLFAKTPVPDQVMQLEVMITASAARRPQLLLGDMTDVFTPFAVAIPGMGHKLKVVYAVHSGAAHELFKETQVEDKLVCLTGEFIKEVQLPTTLVLPASSFDCVKVKVPSGAEFHEKRLDALNHKETWFTAGKLTDQVLVLSLMPVPAFLVYDCFDKGIDALVLYERWMKACTQDMTSFIKFNTVFRAFCKAQVVASTTRNPQTRLKASFFIESAPPVTQEWKKLVLQYLFRKESNGNEEEVKATPKVTFGDEKILADPQSNADSPQPPSTTPTANPSSVGTTQPAVSTNAPSQEPSDVPQEATNKHVPSQVPTKVPPTLATQRAPSRAPTNVPRATPQISNKNQLQVTPATALSTSSPINAASIKDLTLEQFVTVVATTTQTAIDKAKEAAKEEKAPKKVENLGMCKEMYERLTKMCGLAPGEEDGIPAIWGKLSDKEMSKPMKRSLVKQWIAEQVYFADAKVIAYAPLVTMIINMDFEEDTTRSSKKSAAKGLTPYAVPTLSDREVDAIEDHAEAVESATQTTVKDMEKAGIEAERPKSFTSMKITIRRFANLLLALFGESCLLFKEILGMLTSLDNYGDTAIANMSSQTMAAIMWLVHKQARHFAAGKMDGEEKSVLPEFSIMAVNVQCKQPIIYGDVPLDMYAPASTDTTNGQPGASKRAGSGTNGAPPNKKPRIKALPSYNSIIKEKMEVFRDRAKLPQIKALCDACNIKPKDLFPKSLFPVENFCQKSALFGTCFADCTREHKPVTNEQANHIVTTLKPAIDNPSSVKVTP